MYARTVIALLAFWSGWASACSCAWPDQVTEDIVVQALCDADVVIVGKIASSLEIHRSVTEYKVVLGKTYKGHVTSPAFALSETAGMCGYPFVVGNNYLIFASIQKGRNYLSASICGLTALAEHKAFELGVLDQTASAASQLCTEEASGERRRRIYLDHDRRAQKLQEVSLEQQDKEP